MPGRHVAPQDTAARVTDRRPAPLHPRPVHRRVAGKRGRRPRSCPAPRRAAWRHATTGLHGGAPRLHGLDTLGRPGPCVEREPPRRLRRTRPGGVRDRGAAGRHVGAGPHRPAESPPGRQLRVQRDGPRRARLHHRYGHPVLALRVRWPGVPGDRRNRSRRRRSDCYGHGTHVAGTVGGITYGVAKAVSLYSVRVLNCEGWGTYEEVIAGVDWVTLNHQRPAVANMSLGGGYSEALNDAVTNSVNAGVFYGVAAGNASDDACFYSPASTPSATTVGATD